MTLRTFSIENEDGSTNLVLRCDVLDDKKIVKALNENSIRIIGELSNSSNGALLGEIKINDDELFSIVIKPAVHENPLIDFEWGTLVKREVAAFELSKALGWNIVPLTVLRDVEDMQCSVQVFVPHDPREHYFTFSKNNTATIERFAVFDYLINNADRKAGHILREVNDSFKFQPTANDENISAGTSQVLRNRSDAPQTNSRLAGGNFYGIDHGLSFNVADKLRTVIWEFSETPISEQLLVDIAKNLNSFEEVLLPYLDAHEIEKTVLRAEQLLMNPFHRALDANPRAFPWPLV